MPLNSAERVPDIRIHQYGGVDLVGETRAQNEQLLATWRMFYLTVVGEVVDKDAQNKLTSDEFEQFKILQAKATDIFLKAPLHPLDALEMMIPTHKNFPKKDLQSIADGTYYDYLLRRGVNEFQKKCATFALAYKL